MVLYKYECFENTESMLRLVITVYVCHPTVPSMAASWLFSRLCSGFGGSGGGVFSCLMSDSSTAPAEVRWQEGKKTWERSNHIP